jgi:hypothetical protein
MGRGKVVVSTKSEPWWVLWVCVCPWFVYAPKMLQLCINQLVVQFVQSMWVIELLVNLPSPHPRAWARPSTPKVLWVKERAPIPYSFTIFPLDLHLNLSRNLGTCHNDEIYGKHTPLQVPPFELSYNFIQPCWTITMHKQLVGQHNPNHQIRSICVNMKFDVPMKWNQNQCIHVTLFDFSPSHYNCTTFVLFKRLFSFVIFLKFFCRQVIFILHNSLVMGAIMKVWTMDYNSTIF